MVEKALFEVVAVAAWQTTSRVRSLLNDSGLFRIFESENEGTPT